MPGREAHPQGWRTVATARAVSGRGRWSSSTLLHAPARRTLVIIPMYPPRSVPGSAHKFNPVQNIQAKRRALFLRLLLRDDIGNKFVGGSTARGESRASARAMPAFKRSAFDPPGYLPVTESFAPAVLSACCRARRRARALRHCLHGHAHRAFHFP
jgi:hypothetical protein